MEDAIGPEVAADALDRGEVGDVGGDQPGALGHGVGDVLPAAGREVVDDRHLVAARDQRVDEVRADESGAAADQCLHPAIVERRTCRRRRPEAGWTDDPAGTPIERVVGRLLQSPPP